MFLTTTPSNNRLPPEKLDSFVEALEELESRETNWQVTDSVQLDFNTHHPQGLVKIGDEYILSSVEKHFFKAGKGHLFKFDSDGQLLDSVVLGDKKRYHPGGIDFDGENIWVSVAEYKPHSTTTVYKVDPNTLEAEEAFDVDDHIGAITIDRETGHLHGATWDSERIYEWDSTGAVLSERQNRNRKVNYQDWKYVGENLALASGVRRGKGGIELVPLYEGPPEAQLPIANRSPSNRPLTQNPMTFRYENDEIRLFLVPDDEKSEMYVLTPSVDAALVPNGG